ncbi:GntR family transcriptional regulator (plasmid) [Skermanella rosea]|uniref:GntR family transcriptional regulator n=1 Tax=Skermanella rosea TaxID=1817965 RepID=UPI0019325976|nr:GntR family transcriptional regulator [Skermanella rosea]UEM07000.1 GntR family transcriptional regulator [Skermanella rosea]
MAVPQPAAEQGTEAGTSFKMQAYRAVKDSILAMDVYGRRGEIRIDDREVAQALGISRTPVREALILLEHEGFVRAVPRRGIVVVRKTRREIVDMVVVWAALEGMAARLATARASDEDLGALVLSFRETPLLADARESGASVSLVPGYPDRAMELGRGLIRLSGCALIETLTGNMAPHMRGIRKLELLDGEQAARAAACQLGVIEALEARDADAAEALILRHNLDLALHIQRSCDFPD